MWQTVVKEQERTTAELTRERAAHADLRARMKEGKYQLKHSVHAPVALIWVLSAHDPSQTCNWTQTQVRFGFQWVVASWPCSHSPNLEHECETALSRACLQETSSSEHPCIHMSTPAERHAVQLLERVAFMEDQQLLLQRAVTDAKTSLDTGEHCVVGWA